MKTNLIINGAAGRMGKRIVAIAIETGNFNIIAAVDHAEHPDLGKDAGILAGAGELGIQLTSDFPEEADVLIDFSLPQAADRTIDHCAENGIALVMGTTGLTSEHLDKIAALARKTPVIQATNMSVGMNSLFKIVAKTAQMLGINRTTLFHKMKKYNLHKKSGE